MASTTSNRAMVALCVVMGSLMAVEVSGSNYRYGYCPSYCDLNGAYHNHKYCHYPEQYCCGTGQQLECCQNRSRDVTGYFPEGYNCNTSSWFEIHWQVMMTMTGTIILVMLFAACCCQCCKIYAERSRLRGEHAIRFSSSTTDTSQVTEADVSQFIAESAQASGAEAGQVQIQAFNPDSPFAFTPPQYADLPKEPPKYYEVFGSEADGGDGIINPCYIPETPPPAFAEAVSFQAGPHPHTDADREEPARIEVTTVTADGAAQSGVAAHDDERTPLEVSSASTSAQSQESGPQHAQVPCTEEAQPLAPTERDFVEVDLDGGDADSQGHRDQATGGIPNRTAGADSCPEVIVSQETS